jgi:hypothetical protein
MDTLIDILYVFLRWRLLLSIGLSIAMALFLSQAFEGFTAGYCISLTLLGVGFGILWQGRADVGIGLLDKVPPVEISKPVAFLGFIVIGLFWGGFATWFFGSSILGGLALVASVMLVGLWHYFVLKRQVSVGYLAFASISLLTGLGLLQSLLLTKT